MLQAPMLDGLSFDPFSLFDDGLAGANQWIGTTFCTGNGRKADHALRLKPDHFIGIPPAGAVCP
ncbi:hypothetical protein, partial [Pelagibacterium sediminicola]|uniref:hypothetical protein n=1 Tax=Pelagibacterium sediminicola TaxID=2248761 RepID=UPI001AECC0D4